MSEFHNEPEHDKSFALLFASHNIEERFKTTSKGIIKYHIINDREEKRMCSMLDSVGQIGNEFIGLQQSAISAVAFANSPEEALLKTLGLVRVVPSGMAVCPHCLAKAILACEENLAVLKDIQEAIKSY